MAPGIGFGEHGEGYVRIAMVENEHRIRQAARNIKKFLSQPPDTLHNVIPIAQKAGPSRRENAGRSPDAGDRAAT